eukprot:292519-Amphidinium_carterae.1
MKVVGYTGFTCFVKSFSSLFAFVCMITADTGAMVLGIPKALGWGALERFPVGLQSTWVGLLVFYGLSCRRRGTSPSRPSKGCWHHFGDVYE